MACAVGDELIYFNDEYEDGATPDDIVGARKQRIDFTHTIKEKPKTRTRGEEELSLYGKYNEKQLSIDLNPIDEAYMVSITDESGNAVYEKPINAGSIVGLNIDISKYPEGNYTVTVENSNESFTGEFKAQLTGIDEVRSKKIEAKGYIYNLQGQRLRSLQKGLNIVNGQKVFVK
jgi:flagellar hook assembly protein FlgD